MLTSTAGFRDENGGIHEGGTYSGVCEHLHIDLVALQCILQSHASLALSQNPCLPRNVSQMTDNLLITFLESIHRIRDANIFAEIHDQFLTSAEIVPRDTWEQVVHGLELESTMEKVEPLGAVNIHGGAQHTLRERLGNAKVCCRHGEVRKCDLHMHRHCDHVAEQHECDARTSSGNRFVDGEIAEPGPEEQLASDLQVTMPPRGAFARSLTQKDVLPGEDVEIEATEAQNRIVEVVLVREHEFREWVVSHDAVIICRTKALEEAMRDGKEWNVLDIRIVIGTVGDDVVDIVVALPPATAETTEKVGNEYADTAVDVEVVGDAHMAGIMDREDQLVPEHA